jgi:hypothetical protein
LWRHAFTAPGRESRCPLDAELSLPAHCYADLLREWAVYRLVQMLCSGARTLAIVVCVAGLASSVPALLRVFRSPVRTDRPGRPRLVLAQRLRLGQVVTR